MRRNNRRAKKTSAKTIRTEAATRARQRVEAMMPVARAPAPKTEQCAGRRRNHRRAGCQDIWRLQRVEADVSRSAGLRRLRASVQLNFCGGALSPRLGTKRRPLRSGREAWGPMSKP